MEGFIFIFVIVLVVVLFSAFFSGRGSVSPVSSANRNSQNREGFLKDMESKIVRQLARLSTKRNKITLNLRASEAELRYADKLDEQITRLEKEYEPIRQELAEINESRRLNERQELEEQLALFDKHKQLALLLVSRKKCTKEQANTAIYRSLARRQQKHQNDGLSKDDAKKKAEAEIYSIVDRES